MSTALKPTAVSRIESAIADIADLRVAWLSERPKATASGDADAFLSGLRGEYRWHKEQSDRLVKARRALTAMIEDCEVSMDEIAKAAGLLEEIGTAMRRANG